MISTWALASLVGQESAYLDLLQSVLLLAVLCFSLSSVLLIVKTLRRQGGGRGQAMSIRPISGTLGISSVSRITAGSSWKSRTNKSGSGKASGSGSGKISTVAAFIVVPFVLIMILASISIPVEKAMVLNNVRTTGRLYLPHVTAEMDQYHFYADPDGDASKRMLLTFCTDKGFEPKWDEGQTLKSIRYRAWPNCLELLGVTGERDEQGKLITKAR